MPKVGKYTLPLFRMFDETVPPSREPSQGPREDNNLPSPNFACAMLALFTENDDDVDDGDGQEDDLMLT